MNEFSVIYIYEFFVFVTLFFVCCYGCLETSRRISCMSCASWTKLTPKAYLFIVSDGGNSTPILRPSHAHHRSRVASFGKYFHGVLIPVIDVPKVELPVVPAHSRILPIWTQTQAGQVRRDFERTVSFRIQLLEHSQIGDLKRRVTSNRHA